MHRQASNKFDTIEQGQKMVQELIQELTKYTARMVQYPDDYSFRRRLIAALRPSLQKEVLRRGCQGPHISYCCLCSLRLCNRRRSRV